MPVYEYECTECDNAFEVQQKMIDDPVKTCPECGGEVRKLISMSSFQLKGGGWYSDGYSGSSNGKGKTNGGSSPAKEKKSPPPCQKGENSACKSCPAASS